MGKIKQGILGGFSGKVANVVGSSWKGIAVIKSRPLSVANPKTPGQVAQRGAMSSIVEVARLLLASVLKPYWNPFAQKMSGYNAFVRENIAAFSTAGFVNFANFFSMRGSLIGVIVNSATASAATNILSVPFSGQIGIADGITGDDVLVVYYNETQDYWATALTGATRGSSTVTITDTVMMLGDALHIYTSAARADKSKVSDSTYKTINVTA